VDARRVIHQRERYWKLFGVLVIPDMVCQIAHADSAARVSRKRKDYGNMQWGTTSAAVAEIGH